MNSKELAKLAGVSQATVSLCLNDSPRVAESTKAKVLELARQYHFTQNSHAQSLRASKSGTIGMIFPHHFVDFSVNPYFNFLYNRIRQKLVPLGLELLVVYSNDRKGSREYVDSLLRSRRIDGLISCRTDLYIETLCYMKENGMPCVYLLTDEMEMNGAPYVLTDNVYGARLVANHFADIGMKRVMCVGLDIRTTASSIRIAAFKEALADRGIAVNSSDVLLLKDTSFETGRALALEKTDVFAAHDAVFVQSDVAAMGIIEGLREKGIAVPNDIRVIGHDNNPCGAWLHPQLTTVNAVDEVAADMICTYIFDGLSGIDIANRRHVYRPELIIRESCE